MNGFYKDFIAHPSLDLLPVFEAEKYESSEAFEMLSSRYENFGLITYTTMSFLQVDTNFAFGRNSTSGVVNVFYKDEETMKTLVNRFKGLKKHTVGELSVTSEISEFFPSDHKVRNINFTVESV